VINNTPKPKPLGIRNGLKIYTKLKTKTPLKSHKLLKPNVYKLAKTPIKKVSKKQAKENTIWRKVKQERIKLIIDKYGYLMCELCKKALDMSGAEGHHNNHNRRENSPSNIRILCHVCNCYTVEDNNIKDVLSIL
jgi:hypothetical protein